MNTKTRELFERVQKFERERETINTEFDKQVSALKQYKGSKGYQEKSKEIEKNRAAALEYLREQTAGTLNYILRGMTAAIDSRPMEPPTAEHLALINALKLKKKPTQEELERAAQTVKDNPLSLALVSEIALDNGYNKGYGNLGREMTNQAATNTVRTLNKELQDLLQYDTTKASRISARFLKEHYGTDVSLIKRKPHNTKEGFYAEFAGLDNNSLEQFERVVDV